MSTGHEAGGIRGGPGTPGPTMRIPSATPAGPTPTHKRTPPRCTQRPRVLRQNTHTPPQETGGTRETWLRGPGGARAGAGQGLARAGQGRRESPTPKAQGARAAAAPAPPRAAPPRSPASRGLRPSGAPAASF